MPRPRGFDAGRLMEGETARSTEQPTEVLKDAPLRSELDPALLEKLVALPQVVVGSLKKDPQTYKQELRKELKRLENNKRIEMTEWSYELLDSDAFIIGPAETVDLVHLSVADLGLSQGATLKEILMRAQERGLALVPPEAGLRLRMVYTNQPFLEYLIMGMQPIDDGDRVGILSVRRQGESVGGALRIDFEWPDPVNGWPASTHFVFRKLREA